MTKKVLALLLVVCMVVGMIPTFASAAEPATVAVSGKTGRTYYTEKRMAAMQNNIEQYQWAQDMRDTAVKNADSYLKKADNLGVDLAEYAYSHLLPSQEIPRGILVGLRWDPMGYHCKFCDKDLRLIRSRDKLYDTNPFGIDPDPNDEEIIVEPWKIQCPNCRRCFPSNDFKSFYESGLDEHGNFSYEKALQDGQEFLVNEDFPEKDEYVDGNGIIHNEGVHNWGVDDSRGYRTGKTYSPGDVSLYKTRYGVDFSVMEET